VLGSNVRGMAIFSPSDLLYVTGEYRTMAELCDGRAESVDQCSVTRCEGRELRL